MTDVSIKTTHGIQVIHTTPNHPFWDATQSVWTQASALPVGDTLLTTHGTTTATIAAVISYSHPAHRLNLTVNVLHTYYVMAGQTPILVHNVCDWTASDEELDDIHDQYGPDVSQGVEYMMQRYNEGDTGHALNGIGASATATADYLAAPRNCDYEDSRTGNVVSYDSSNHILVIQTAQDIHACNYSQTSWDNNVDSRYVELPGED